MQIMIIQILMQIYHFQQQVRKDILVKGQVVMAICCLIYIKMVLIYIVYSFNSIIIHQLYVMQVKMHLIIVQNVDHQEQLKILEVMKLIKEVQEREVNIIQLVQHVVEEIYLMAQTWNIRYSNVIMKKMKEIGHGKMQDIIMEVLWIQN